MVLEYWDDRTQEKKVCTKLNRSMGVVLGELSRTYKVNTHGAGKRKKKTESTKRRKNPGNGLLDAQPHGNLQNAKGLRRERSMRGWGKGALHLVKKNTGRGGKKRNPIAQVGGKADRGLRRSGKIRRATGTRGKFVRVGSRMSTQLLQRKGKKNL